MAWFCAKTTGRDTRAAWYLEHRAHIRAFVPIIHDYDPMKWKPRGQKFNVKGLFPGYVFIKVETLAERSAAINAIGVAYLLGSRIDGEFYPKEMPTKWMTALMDNGPIEINKPKPKSEWRKGTKVKLAINNLKDCIDAEIYGLDKAGKVMVVATLLGGPRVIHVDDSRLEVAE